MGERSFSVIFVSNQFISSEVEHFLKLLSREEGVSVEKVIASYRPGKLLHLPHGGDGIPGFPLPDQPGHAVHSEVVEHPVVSARNRLVWPGRPELTSVFPVVVDPAGIDEDGV